MAERYNKGKGRGIAFVRSLVGHKGRACVTWPFTKNSHGHGMFGHNGKHYFAHRYICELVNGPAPAKHHAAHSCGNAHLGCVNPIHLSWKTQSENELDKRAHGTAGGGQGTITQLTAEQVAEIRASKGKVTADKLAEKFGLKRGGIRYWWSTTHDPKPPSTEPSAIARRRPRAHLVYGANGHG